MTAGAFLQAVGDGQHRSACGGALQCVQYPPLRVAVEVRGDLIQQQDFRRGGHRSCNGKQLQLPLGESGICRRRVVSVGERGNAFLQSDQLRGLFHLLPADGRVKQRNLICHCAGNHTEGLFHIAEQPPLPRVRNFGCICAVDQNPPSARFIKSQQQAENGTFPRAGSPNKRGRLTAVQREAKVVEYIAVAVVVKAHMTSASDLPAGSKSLPPLPPPMGRPVREFLKICSKPRNRIMPGFTLA